MFDCHPLSWAGCKPFSIVHFKHITNFCIFLILRKSIYNIFILNCSQNREIERKSVRERKGKEEISCEKQPMVAIAVIIRKRVKNFLPPNRKGSDEWKKEHVQFFFFLELLSFFTSKYRQKERISLLIASAFYIISKLNELSLGRINAEYFSLR